MTVPSPPRKICGVSACTSKVSARSGRPWACSSLRQTSTMTSTCSRVETLGSVMVRPSGRRPARLMSVETNRSSVRRPRRRAGASRHLKRVPMNGGGEAPLHRLGHAGGHENDVLILALRVIPVAVLRIEAQVLDGLVLQLALDVGDEAGVPGQPDELGHARHAAVSRRRGEGLLAPLRRELRGVAIHAHVDGVHGLADLAITRVLPGQQRVGAREGLAGAAEVGLGEDAHVGAGRGRGHRAPAWVLS